MSYNEKEDLEDMKQVNKKSKKKSKPPKSEMMSDLTVDDCYEMIWEYEQTVRKMCAHSCLDNPYTAEDERLHQKGQALREKAIEQRQKIQNIMMYGIKTETKEESNTVYIVMCGSEIITIFRKENNAAEFVTKKNIGINGSCAPYWIKTVIFNKNEK